MMDYLNYKVMNGMPNAPSDAMPLELSRMQMEVQRRDAIIEEQQKRIFQLEDEVKRCNKQIQDLVLQLAQFKDQKPKQDQNYKPAQSRYWTAEEHDRFLDAIKRFGPKDVKAIASYVGTRNPTQVRTHAQKYYLRLERERKRREDADKGITGEGNDRSPSDDSDRSQQTTPNDGSMPNNTDIENENGEGKSDADRKNASRKRASTAGRRASMPADIASAHMVMKHEVPPANSAMAANNAVVHSTRQQLQSAGPIVSSLKGWSQHEYNLFIEGLLAFPEEKDINKKCILISEKFLPKYSAEDIKQCYAILHNYVRNKEVSGQLPMEHGDYLDHNKRMKPSPEGGIPHGYMSTYTTTGLPPSPADTGMMRGFQVPYGNNPNPNSMRSPGYPYPYNSVPGGYTPGSSNFPPPMNDMPSAQANYAAEAAMMRRASFPMDTFSLNKTYADAISENIFPSEFPTWNNENGPVNTTATSEDIHPDAPRNTNL